MIACEEVRGLLPWYCNSTLEEGERAAVAAHVEACDECVAALADWRLISHAVAEAPAPAPGAVAAPSAPPTPERRVSAEAMRMPVAAPRRALADSNPSPPPSLARLLALARAQARLLPLGLWPAVATVMAIGVAIVLASDWSGGTALGVLAPLAAAASVAFTVTRDNDPRLDLALASPVSPRLVLLARLLVVLAYDVALALAASAALVLAGGQPLGPLLGAWLLPMFALTGAALLATTVLDAGTAMAFAFALWTLRWVLPVDPSAPVLLAVGAACMALVALRFEPSPA